MSERTGEHDHGPGCACPWCSSERLTYCLLTRGSADHQDHLVVGCPARPRRPDEPCCDEGMTCLECDPHATFAEYTFPPTAGGGDRG